LRSAAVAHIASTPESAPVNALAVRQAATVAVRHITVERHGHLGLVLLPQLGVRYTAVGPDGQLFSAAGFWRLRRQLWLSYGAAVRVSNRVVDVGPEQPGLLWPRKPGSRAGIDQRQGGLL
jgi:hypothetical protein